MYSPGTFVAVLQEEHMGIIEGDSGRVMPMMTLPSNFCLLDQVRVKVPSAP